MEFQTSVDDYLVAKVLATADCAAQFLQVTKSCNAEALGSTFVLKSGSTTLTNSRAMLGYISDLAPSAQLFGEGKSSTADSDVNEWLDFSYNTLETPMQVLLALASDKPEFAMGSSEKTGAEVKALADVKSAISSLESHLKDKTFLVGERLTVADISLCCAVSELVKLGQVDGSEYMSVFRWFMTISSRPCLSKHLGSPTLAAPAMAVPSLVVESLGKRWGRSRIRVKELLAEGLSAEGKTVTVKGWVRTVREAEKGELVFVELNDGSTVLGLQLVLEKKFCEGTSDVAGCGGVGACISVMGVVVKSPAKGQLIEIKGRSAKVVGPVLGGDGGTVGGKNYPMAKKKHSLEFLREIAHLRPRSKVFSACQRMRHAMAFATHKFFNDRSFLYIHTPLLTAADCEGAGEQFVVTTLLPDHGKVADIPKQKDGTLDHSKDFFGKRACLTVSGQLNVETHCCALSDVYTFGPTFRAENSHTKRHLCEFWMIEPEIAFSDLSDDMALAEDYVKFCTAYALEHCADDLHFLEHVFPDGEKGLKARLQNVVDNDFARITYTEAVEMLQKHVAEKKIKFEVYPEWGDDLGSEHERYMSEKVFARPTIVINYPKGIKAFYMRMNDDNETVAAMDILVPKIGELIGGSQREERLDKLEERCIAQGLSPDDIKWYADLRRYGTVPHAGFGLGFERLVMFVTGLENIRDVIPFPRAPGKIDF